MKYLIPVVYQVYGRVEVEADSPEKALQYAIDNQDDLPLPDESFYLDDSFQIDTDGIIMDEFGNDV